MVKLMVKNLSLKHSLRTKMLLTVSLSVFVLMATLIWLGSARIQRTSLIQIEHEGLVVADALKAGMGALIIEDDIEGVQAFIDDFVSLRERNDIEINVVVLGELNSEVIASNVRDNIEASDPEEHEELLAAFEHHRPLVDVGRDCDEDDDEGEDVDDEDELIDASHPDYYIPEDSRSLSVMTPIMKGGKPYAGINLELSLHYLDKELAEVAQSAVLALALGSLVLACLLTPFLNRKLFRPLRHLAAEMYAFGTGEEIGELAPSPRRDEIGVLENEFYNMVARINSAEAMRKELEQARAEREKHEMQEKLRHAQKMEALGTLAGGIAHDFNNILTPIIGYTHILLSQAPEEGEQREALQQVGNAGYRAQELVKQILTFSRQNKDEKAPMSMMPVVKETLKLLRASIPANIEIREDVDHESAAIMGNGTHIHQIVLNLATNACHAMIEQGGRLDVVLGETTFEVDTPISSSQVLMAGHYLQLSVADTGQGMREEVKERIFDPYFTTKKEGEGTGLGLAMVHGIVQEMRGGIVVDTEIGKGTRFDVYLPVVERSVSEISPSPHEDCPGGSERILIVDDEEPIANMVGIMLRDLGYHCTVMTETREALEHALDRSYTYDLIISDVAMPAMTGVEFARALADGGSDVPLILCSGYTGGINWRTAGAVGIHAMVMKPIIRSKLAQAVREVLDASVLAIPA